LSGDYSFPQEPVPSSVFFPESVLGGLALLLPPLLGIGFAARLLWLRAPKEWRIWDEWSQAYRKHLRGEPVEPEALRGPEPKRWIALSSSTLLALGLVWLPVAYFPHSNIPLVLPTVRAERFWYLPLIGAACVLPVFLVWVTARLRWRHLGVALVAAFFGFQALRARAHALDYADDLAFWDATRRASQESAKAHLNYSVMIGARGDLEARLAANKRAMELAPRWPMAHVYYGDTLCRLDRPDEAWPHYVEGWKLAPNDSNLIALSLQCLWDKRAITKHQEELSALADAPEHAGSWLAYLARDIVMNGEKHGGVERKYRPRGYNEGPKKD
jgi:tetratricopeptide (TPR) repeat protein